MMKKLFPTLALLALVLTTLACGALNDIRKDVDGAKATVEAVQTEASDNGDDAEPTDKPAKPTRTPKPTKESTDAEPTAEPEATERGDDNSVPLGEVPEDIPMLPQDTVDNFFVMEGIVSYQTDVDFAEAVDFYQDEMPNHGWEVDKTTTILTSEAAILSYTKEDQTALLTISVDASAVYVQILISAK